MQGSRLVFDSSDKTGVAVTAPGTAGHRCWDMLFNTRSATPPAELNWFQSRWCKTEACIRGTALCPIISFLPTTSVEGGYEKIAFSFNTLKIENKNKNNPKTQTHPTTITNNNPPKPPSHTRTANNWVDPRLLSGQGLSLLPALCNPVLPATWQCWYCIAGCMSFHDDATPTRLKAPSIK